MPGSTRRAPRSASSQTRNSGLDRPSARAIADALALTAAENSMRDSAGFIARHARPTQIEQFADPRLDRPRGRPRIRVEGTDRRFADRSRRPGQAWVERLAIRVPGNTIWMRQRRGRSRGRLLRKCRSCRNGLSMIDDTGGGRRCIRPTTIRAERRLATSRIRRRAPKLSPLRISRSTVSTASHRP